MKSTVWHLGNTMLIIGMAMLLLTACNHRTKLKIAVEAANKQCPIAMGKNAEVTSIAFDGENVVYTLLMKETPVGISILNKSPQAMQNVISTGLSNASEDVRKMVELVANAKAGLKFICRDTQGNEAVCTLAANELLPAINSTKVREENNLRQLEEMLDIANTTFPIQIDELTRADRVTLEGNNVVYDYTIDDKQLDMNLMREDNGRLMKETLRESFDLSDKTLRMFLEACINCDKGLHYRYRCSHSGDTLLVTFSAGELKDML